MKILLYCTKSKNKYDRLVSDEHYGKPFYLYGAITENFESLNGKITGECEYEAETFSYMRAECLTHKYLDLLKESCLTDKEMYDYLKGKNGDLIHIKNLHIFNKPKELSDYYTKQCQFGKCSTCKYGKNNIICSTIDTPITKAPQNMMYVYDNGEKKILISIQPQWMCKILNGEKTIEVRKKVLREMLNNG